jgi:chromosome partitioning protein
MVNMKGGVAKTTLSVNMADYLSRTGKRVLLVDLDPQFNATQCLFSPETYAHRKGKGDYTITSIFDDSPAPAISPINGGAKTSAIELSDIKPWKLKNRFDVVPGDLDLYRLDMTPGQGRENRLKRYLEEYKANNEVDIVIIDTPPTPSHWMISGLLASSYYLVPVRPEPLSRTGIDLLRGVIGRCTTNYGHKIECAGVVLTMTDRRTQVYDQAVEVLTNDPFWKDKRFKADLPARTAIAKAQGDQVLILDTKAYAARTALAQICSEFLSRIKYE